MKNLKAYKRLGSNIQSANDFNYPDTYVIIDYSTNLAMRIDSDFKEGSLVIHMDYLSPSTITKQQIEDIEKGKDYQEIPIADIDKILSTLYNTFLNFIKE